MRGEKLDDFFNRTDSHSIILVAKQKADFALSSQEQGLFHASYMKNKGILLVRISVRMTEAMSAFICLFCVSLNMWLYVCVNICLIKSSFHF